uniref:Nuclear cap-binding protein subunit 1 n=1 Tax=Parascaris univalens TaxID=6257 RepID=A0A914ZXQ8_PARUN
MFCLFAYYSCAVLVIKRPLCFSVSFDSNFSCSVLFHIVQLIRICFSPSLLIAFNDLELVFARCCFSVFKEDCIVQGTGTQCMQKVRCNKCGSHRAYGKTELFFHGICRFRLTSLEF